MPNRTTSRSLAARVAACAVLVLAAAGSDVSRAGGASDHDRARAALEAGEILPLRTILERIERDHPGQVMEVELEREHGQWIYEVKLLRADGTLVKLGIDARDARVLGIEGKGQRSSRRGTR